MKKVVFALCVLTIIFQLCFVPAVSAKLYTWIDRSGVTRRTYYPPPLDQVQKKNQGRNAPAYKKKKADNQVELYVTSWCPYCKQAEDYFRSRGVAIKKYDIEKDQKAAARKNRLTQRKGVPFAVVNGKRISGYAPDRYSKALR